jgi:hypothetical protein
MELVPLFYLQFSESNSPLVVQKLQLGGPGERLFGATDETGLKMATRDKRLAQFNGEGEPPPNLPVQVLCEDQSGTYELPFACRFTEGAWRNHESGGALEANVVGWRLRRG